MRGRLFLAGLGVVAGLSPLFAQFPPPPAPVSPASPFPPARGPTPYRPLTPPIQIPRLPDPPQPRQPAAPVQPAGGTVPVQPPRPLPPGVAPAAPLTPPPAAQPPDGSAPPVPVEVPLPYPENKTPLDTGAVSLKLIRGAWQVWAGPRLIRDLGNDETGARDIVRLLRELRPTEWVTIGSPRPVVEYGLTNGRPAVTAGFPRLVVPIDFKTVRVEAVRGVWCLRDDGNILFNCGLRKPDADQALAVIRKYGFNRIGMVGGKVGAPALTYFFVALDSDGGPRPPVNGLAAAAQEASLSRTGIPVPGVGYFGEMLKIDPRKVEMRKDGYEWVVAAGPDVLARFGAGESTAREAVRVIQDGRFTEFCTVGSAGLTFFLVNGKAPTRVPFSVQGRRFDPTTLKTRQFGPRWAVTENGRHLFDVGTKEEAESVVRLLQNYGFDQVCQVGSSPRAGMTFLARSRW